MEGLRAAFLIPYHGQDRATPCTLQGVRLGGQALGMGAFLLPLDSLYY